YVPKLHPRIETLLSFHQRPLTVVYDHSVGIPASVRAPNGSVAIRVATDQFCQELISQLNSPLLSTSANESSESYPPHFGAISSEILKSVDYVVKYRQDDKTPGEPSAVARLDRHLELEFLRE
ncbi:MAG: L-threonylcarbamoyladenylate synthase, partial [Bacteroidota bacterium]